MPRMNTTGRRAGGTGQQGPTVDSASHVNGGIALTPLMLLSGIVVFGTAFYIFSQVQITSTEQTVFDLLASGIKANTDTGAQIGQFISQQTLDHDHLIANTIGWGVQIALFLLSIPVAQALMLMHRMHNTESSASLSATAQKYADWQTFCVRALVGGDIATDFYFVVRGHIIVTGPWFWPSITGFDFGVILVGIIYPVAICFVTVFCGRLFIVCIEAFVARHILHKV